MPLDILDTNQNPEIDCMDSRDRGFVNVSNDSNNIIYEQMNLLGSLIEARNFNAAKSSVNLIDQSFEEGLDAYYIGDNLIQIFENGNSTTDNSILVQNLKYIANKSHPSSGYAQAFHYYLTGEFVDNLDISFLEKDIIGERQEGFVKSRISDYKIKVFPNPASDFINIVNTQNINELKIYSTTGVLMHESRGASQISTTSWESGIYLMSIKTLDNSPILINVIVNK